MDVELSNNKTKSSPDQQSGWDTLKQVGQPDTLSKYGRHTKEYLNSEFREKERRKEQNFDKLIEKAYQDEAEGNISADYRKVYEEELRKKLKSEKRDIRQDYAEWLLKNEKVPKIKRTQKIGDAAIKSDVIEPEPDQAPAPETKPEGAPAEPEEELAPEGTPKKEPTSEDEPENNPLARPINKKDIEEAIERERIKAIEKTKAEATAKEIVKETTKAEQTEFKSEAELAKAIAEVQARIATNKAKLEEAKKQRSLIAINADFTHDKKELARDYAEQELNAEVAKSKFFTRLWKGDLFKKYYWKKYEKAILSGERKVHLNGEELELDKIMEKRSHDAIERFVYGVLDDPDTSRYIHRNIGKNGKNGERVTEADEKTTENVKNRIKETIRGLGHGLSEQEFIASFREKIKQTSAESRDKKEPKDEIALYDNYAEVAFAAYQLAEQHQSLDRVMEGFKIYNAEVRNNQRTEAHRDATDKIIEKLEKSSIGLVVPAEIIAGATATVAAVVNRGAAIALGFGVSSLSSGFREKNRAVDERTRVMRKAAEGVPVLDQIDLSGMSERKRQKYEKKIGGRYYKIESAANLFNQLYEARKAKDEKALLGALAELKVRIDYSDSEQKDLIAYSSADAMGRERLGLDQAVILAEKELSEENRKNLKTHEAVIRKRIDEEVNEKDKNFNKYRAWRFAGRTGRTLALGAVLALTVQELAAAASPNKIGVFEKTSNNSEGATETILAKIFKPRYSNGEIAGFAGGTEAAYQQAGYDVIKTADGFTEVTPPYSKPVNIGETTGIMANVRYANNATQFADGNELGLHIDQGAFFTKISGSSSLPSGETIDVAENIANGNVRMLFKIGGKTFESSPISIDQGQAIFGHNGWITTSTGEMIHVIGDNGERLFESAQVAVEDYVSSNMTHHFTSIATITGDNAVGDIVRTVSNIVEQPATYVVVAP